MELTFQINGFWSAALDVALLAAGLALIIKGGDVFVDASVKIARALRVPEIVIGATIVSVGTTLPEIITSTTSVVKGMAESDGMLAAGYDSLAVGNAVGSMMCNAGLILGIVMLIRPPAAGKGFAVKGAYLLAASAVLAVFALTGSRIAVAEGVVLLALFVAFIGLNVYEAARSGAGFSAVATQEDLYSTANERLCGGKTLSTKRQRLKPADAFLFIAGAAATALGAVLLVDNAQSVCVGLGIPQQIVGITVVATGTSLPELATALTSLKKGTSDIGLGNVIGANVINATLLLGLISCLSGKGMAIDAITKNVAVWVMLAIEALLVIPSALTKKTYKAQGATMLALYLGFIVYNVAVIVI